MTGPETSWGRVTAACVLFGLLAACGDDKPTGPSGGPPITRQSTIALVARDLAYDSTRQLLYASVASTDRSYGNRVVAIDPVGGTVRSSVFVGSEPNRLAISDNGQFLYVGIDGARSIRRVVLKDLTAELQFPAKAAVWTASFVADDMEVPPGQPHTVVIAIGNPNSGPRLTGIVVFDDGVPRPEVAPPPGNPGGHVITYSDVPTTLYGYNNENTEFGFRQMEVESNGIRETEVRQNLLYGFDTDIEFDRGRVYATSGAVVDPQTGRLAGTFAATGFVAPDMIRNRVFFLSPGAKTIRVFDGTTFTPSGTIEATGVVGATGSLTRLADSGLAFRTADQVVIVPTSAIVPPT